MNSRTNRMKNTRKEEQMEREGKNTRKDKQTDRKTDERTHLYSASNCPQQRRRWFLIDCGFKLFFYLTIFFVSNFFFLSSFAIIITSVQHTRKIFVNDFFSRSRNSFLSFLPNITERLKRKVINAEMIFCFFSHLVILPLVACSECVVIDQAKNCLHPPPPLPVL